MRGGRFLWAAYVFMLDFSVVFGPDGTLFPERPLAIRPGAAARQVSCLTGADAAGAALTARLLAGTPVTDSLFDPLFFLASPHGLLAGML